MLELAVVSVARGRSEIRLQGDVDAKSAQMLFTVIDDVFMGRGTVLCVDLSRVTSLDQGGVRVLCRVADHATLDGVRVTLVNPSPAVRHVLELVGADLANFEIEYCL